MTSRPAERGRAAPRTPRAEAPASGGPGAPDGARPEDRITLVFVCVVAGWVLVLGAILVAAR